MFGCKPPDLASHACLKIERVIAKYRKLSSTGVISEAVLLRSRRRCSTTPGTLMTERRRESNPGSSALAKLQPLSTGKFKPLLERVEAQRRLRGGRFVLVPLVCYGTLTAVAASIPEPHNIRRVGCYERLGPELNALPLWSSARAGAVSPG